MDAWLRAIPEGGITAALVLGTFVLPGLALVLLEALRGHELRLASYVWAACALPVTVSLAGYCWKMGALKDPASVQAAAGRTIELGVALSVALVVLGLPAMARARRHRRPLAPPAPAKAAPR